MPQLMHPVTQPWTFEYYGIGTSAESRWLGPSRSWPTPSRQTCLSLTTASRYPYSTPSYLRKMPRGADCPHLAAVGTLPYSFKLPFPWLVDADDRSIEQWSADIDNAEVQVDVPVP